MEAVTLSCLAAELTAEAGALTAEAPAEEVPFLPPPLGFEPWLSGTPIPTIAAAVPRDRKNRGTC